MSWIEDLASTPEGRKSLRRARFNIEVTERICEIMQEKGLDYEDMSNALDVRKKYFKRMLDGSREIDLNDLADIAEVFDMEVVVDFRMRAKEQPAPPRDSVRGPSVQLSQVIRLFGELENLIRATNLTPQNEQPLLAKVKELVEEVLPAL